MKNKIYIVHESIGVMGEIRQRMIKAFICKRTAKKFIDYKNLKLADLKKRFEGFDPEIIKDKIQSTISTYFINLKRRDKIPKSDMIALIESVPGVDSVSFYFVGQANEAYHATIDNLPNTSVSELNTNIGFDEFGDIIIGRGELVVIRGGWSDRYGSAYEVGIVPGKPSALNISIKGIVPVTYLSELGAETKAQLIAANK